MNDQKSIKLHEAYTARSRESLNQLVSHSFDDKYSEMLYFVWGQDNVDMMKWVLTGYEDAFVRELLDTKKIFPMERFIQDFPTLVNIDRILELAREYGSDTDMMNMLNKFTDTASSH